MDKKIFAIILIISLIGVSAYSFTQYPLSGASLEYSVYGNCAYLYISQGSHDPDGNAGSSAEWYSDPVYWRTKSQYSFDPEILNYCTKGNLYTYYSCPEPGFDAEDLAEYLRQPNANIKDYADEDRWEQISIGSQRYWMYTDGGRIRSEKVECSRDCAKIDISPPEKLDPRDAIKVGGLASCVFCTRDNDCRMGEMCEDGDCVDAPEELECESDGDCSSGEECIGGECFREDEPTPPPEPEPELECESDGDCSSGEECIGGECFREDEPTPPPEPEPEPECTIDSDCPAGQECTSEECVDIPISYCISSNDCPPEQICVDGLCSNVIVVEPEPEPLIGGDSFEGDNTTIIGGILLVILVGGLIFFMVRKQ